MSKVEAKLKEIGVELRELPKPKFTLVHAKKFGNLMFVSGHGCEVFGKCGADLTTEDGYKAARETAITLLSAIKGELGDLDKVKSIVKLLGFVNSDPNFKEQPAVINGASDLFVEVFGEDIGMHARTAVGLAALPRGIAVEIEMIIEVED